MNTHSRPVTHTKPEPCSPCSARAVLTGGLAGGRLPIRKKRGGSADDSQHFFQAIDPASFVDTERLAKELVASMDEIRQSSSAAVRFPGEEDELRAERVLSQGIPLPESVYEELGRKAPGGWTAPTAETAASPA
jgi:LDH2 family malate/lactate/ureidoglycolate dehydrogenase